MYSYRYDSTTHDCAILLDGVVIEHQPLTKTAARISELRAAAVSTATPRPEYFTADGTAKYKTRRARKTAQ